MKSAARSRLRGPVSKQDGLISFLYKKSGAPVTWKRRALVCGSACGPVIVPVFKTGGRRVPPSLVGSTPTRFRQDSNPTDALNHVKVYCIRPNDDSNLHSARLLKNDKLQQIQ